MKKTFSLLIGLIVVVIIIIIVFISQQSQIKQDNSVQSLATPTPVSLIQTTTTPAQPAFYNPKQTQKLLDAMDSPIPLSQADTNAKSTIVTRLHNQSGIVYATNEFTIEYTQAANLFQVEIDTNTITKDKADAVTWMLSQGFTKEGICNLPVMFYLDFPILQEVKQNPNFKFNPIAEGC